MGDDAPPIGIDLGTTYSCVAVWKHDRIEILPNNQGNRTTPSCVAFVDAARLIGDGAKNHAAINPANTIFGKLLFLFLGFIECCYITTIKSKEKDTYLKKHMNRQHRSLIHLSPLNSEVFDPIYKLIFKSNATR
ncbi:unnamed protein product [Lactuca virosa]|uniref:Heat shock protein 70 n=1 Tax=Lactuca virosa TaxID=75947 RepID=A0AAU9MI19_9ASTR|nr:unnamed protein product [Lactuca virosa]